MAVRASKGRGGNGGRGGANNAGRSARGGCGGMRTRSTRMGLNKELKANIFDLGERLSADLMQTAQINHGRVGDEDGVCGSPVSRGALTRV